MMQTKLPNHILSKAISSGNELGWKEVDLDEVINSASENGLATIGGEVQFLFNDGICELYWLSFDANERYKNETWEEYIQRASKEINDQIRKIASRNLKSEAIDHFDFLKEKDSKGIDIYNHLIYLLYFEDEK